MLFNDFFFIVFILKFNLSWEGGNVNSQQMIGDLDWLNHKLTSMSVILFIR